MMLEVVGAALLVAGSALVLWVVIAADASVRPVQTQSPREAEVPILKRAA
jgi:hypothetical protein